MILITGASSGLGEALAKVYASEAKQLILLARSKEKLNRLKKELPCETKILLCDLADRQAVLNAIDKIKQEVQQIDILINNAGIGIFEEFEQTSYETINTTMEVNVLAVFQLTHELLPLLKEGASIINIASMSGKLATVKSSIYAASKAALIQFSTILRMELHKKNIHVLTVNCGPIRTPFHEKADATGEYAKKIERFMLDTDKLALEIKKANARKKCELNRPKIMQLMTIIASGTPKLYETLTRKFFNLK